MKANLITNLRLTVVELPRISRPPVQKKKRDFNADFSADLYSICEEVLLHRPGFWPDLCDLRGRRAVGERLTCYELKIRYLKVSLNMGMNAFGGRSTEIEICIERFMIPYFLLRFCPDSAKKTVGKINENHYSISREPFSIRFKT